MKHLIVACGGTGGHFYPTLAISRAFCDMGNKVTLLVAGAHAKEQLKIAADNGFEACEVPAVRAPSSIFSAIAFPFKMLSCIRAARKKILELKPDVMLGMGSYASLPACLAKPSSLPLILHEGNAFMGKTNRWMAGKAKYIGLSIPLQNEAQTKGTPSELVGMPLREALIKAASNPLPDTEYLQKHDLTTDRPTILIFGGSQGARRINEIMMETLPMLTTFGDRLQFIHLTGTDDNAQLAEAYKVAGAKAYIAKSESEIEKCYLNASLVICRGGASSLCELALFGKPAVIIPLPSAADDHQTVNAKLAESLGGAIHMPQHTAAPQVLYGIIKELLDNPEKFSAMGKALNKLARPNAAQSMAKILSTDY